MDNIQQMPDANMIVRASRPDRTRLIRLHTKLYSDSFIAVLALNCGPAKCQCCMYNNGNGCCLLTFERPGFQGKHSAHFSTYIVSSRASQPDLG